METRNDYENNIANLTADEFAGGYLRQEDFPQPVVATITHAQAEQFPGQRRKKLAIVLLGYDKPLILNSTNRNTLKEQLGNRVSEWIGKKISVYVDRTIVYAGRQTGGIRVAVSPDDVAANAADSDAATAA